MYYHGADAQTRKLIQVAEKERAAMLAAFWAKLFRVRKAEPTGAAANA